MNYESMRQGRTKFIMSSIWLCIIYRTFQNLTPWMIITLKVTYLPVLIVCITKRVILVQRPLSFNNGAYDTSYWPCSGRRYTQKNLWERQVNSFHIKATETWCENLMCPWTSHTNWENFQMGNLDFSRVFARELNTTCKNLCIVTKFVD